MSTKELASAKGVVEPGITMPSPGGSEIEDVRVECVVENDLQLLNKSLEEPSSWSGKYARHKCSTPTRSSYKCPEKRDLPGFHFFHGRPSLPNREISYLARKGSDSMSNDDDIRDSPDSELTKDTGKRKNQKKKRPKRGRPSSEKKKPKTIPRVLLNDWKNQLANNAYVQCPWRECKRIFVTLDRVTEHYRWCSGPETSPPSCETCGNEFPNNERLVAHLCATPCSKTPAERLKRNRSKKDGESDEEWKEEMLNEEDDAEEDTEENTEDDDGELTSASSVSVELVSEVLDLDDDRDRTVVKIELDDERTLDDALAINDASTHVLANDASHQSNRESPSALNGDGDVSDPNQTSSVISLKRKRLDEDEVILRDQLNSATATAAPRTEESVDTTEGAVDKNVDSSNELQNALENTSIINGDVSNDIDTSTTSHVVAASVSAVISNGGSSANAAPTTDNPIRRSRRRAAEEARQSINDVTNHLGSSGDEVNGTASVAGFDIHEQRRQRRLLNDSIPTRTPSPSPASPSTSKTDEDPRQFYSVPDYPEIPETIQQSWKKESQKRRNIICPHPGCTETYISQPGIRQHYYNCPYGPYSKPKFKCLVCGRLYGTEPGVRYHVKRYHHPEKRKAALEDSVDNISLLDATAEDFVDVKPNINLDGAVELAPATPDRYLGNNATVSSVPGNSEGIPRSPYVGVPARGIVEPLPEALAWTLEYHKENFAETNILTDWLPRKSHWQLLPDEEYDTYMPAFPNSMEFILEDGKNGERTKSASLNLFESFTYDQGSLTFVGGPVHAAAWAPIPLQAPSIMQYFAVGGTTHVDVAHFVSKVYIEPGLVQIYGCLNLDVPPPFQAAGRTRPEQSYVVQPSISLSLGIAHDFGAVWEMKWCPSGAYQSTVLPNSTDDVLPRLGLLACACSDGTIRIFSIPHPDRIHHMIREQLDKDDFISVCRISEVITLSSSTDADAAGVLGQCLSLDWAPTDGHTRIVGGFARGAVAVWDLASRSPLVLMKSSFGPTIFPQQCFLAHLEQVQAVRFSPNAMDVLTTVSTDRLCRLWNTANVDVPINEMRRGLMTDAQWLFYWNGIIIAQDDCFNMEHNATYFLECGYWGHQPRLLTPHNGTIWSVSASDWLNTLVSADSSGEVVGAVLPQMMTTLTNHKPFTKRRFCIFRVELEPIKTDTQEESPKSMTVPIKTEPETEPFSTLPSKSAKTKTSKSEKKTAKKTKNPKGSLTAPSTDSLTTLPKTFSEYTKHYRTVFHLYDPENLLTGRDSDRLKYPSTMSATRPDSLPIMSVNRVVWNPNLGSHCWVLSGLLSGFVQLTCVSSLFSPMARKMVTDIKRPNATFDDS